MDINYLLHREQISLMMASKAASGEARHAHRGLARGYGAQLRAGGYPHRIPLAPTTLPTKNPGRSRTAA